MSKLEPPWTVAFTLLLAAILLFLAARAYGEKLSIAALGLQKIDWIRPVWKDTRCNDWPERDGSYKCHGTFYVHPQAVSAKGRALQHEQ